MSDCQSHEGYVQSFLDAERGNDLAGAVTPRAGSRPVSRRSILISAGGTIVLAACGRREVAPVVASKVPVTAQARDFLLLSQVLTGHVDLDPTTAERLVQGFARARADVYSHFGALGALVRPDVSASGLLSAATAAGLRPAALAIVAAWYTGTVGEGTGAVTVSYRDALMQRPVADALVPPTYVGGGPAWWTAPPPDVGLPARAVQASAAARSPEVAR